MPGLILACIVAFVLAGCGGQDDNAGGQAQGMPPVPVAIKTIKPGAVDVYADYPGRVRGAREVQVRARVEGTLLERHYNEGAFVKKGDLLFSIDPDTFQATVDQRKAQLAQARAKLNQARQIWDRVSNLYKRNATSEADRDQAQAGLQTARAAVKLAKANLDSAQIKLDYTSVEAPLSGVTSLQEIDEGALVTHGTLLTTITQLDPVHVLFSVPAKDAIVREKALAAMGKEKSSLTRQAELILPTGKTYSQSGIVDFAQSTIDPDTGTVRLRAIFDNDKRHLVPGRFVRVRIRLETLDHAIVVPNKAVADSQQSSLVYVVTDDNKAKPVPVVLGPVVDDGRVIKKGLSAGDRVITIGLGRLHPGATVKVVPADKLSLSPGRQTGQDAGQQADKPDQDGQESTDTGDQES